jgi:peroxiredoxin
MSPWQRVTAAYRRSRALRWALELLLLCAAVLAMDAFQTRGHVHGRPPELSFSTLQGEPVSLASLRGQPLVLVVWAPWCGVCKLEASNVARARRWLEPRAKVLSIAASYGSVEDVRGFMREQGVDYPVLLADRGFERAFGVRAFPSLFVLDAAGDVVRSTQGYTSTLGLWWRGAL